MDYSDYANLTNMDYYPNEESSRSVLLIVSAVFSWIIVIFSVMLILLILASKELREKASYWFIVSLMVSNIFVGIHLGVEDAAYVYPLCYAGLPLIMTSYHVSVWTIAVYAIAILREAGQEMSLKGATGCRISVVLGISGAVWLACLIEVLVMGFGIAQMDFVEQNGSKLCIFMAIHSEALRIVNLVLTSCLPFLIIFICGIIFIVYCCKSTAVRQTCVPVLLMCILTPLLNLPYLSLFLHLMPGNIGGVEMVNVYVLLHVVGYMLLPFYFMLFGEGRRVIWNCCCRCCRHSDKEETAQLILK